MDSWRSTYQIDKKFFVCLEIRRCVDALSWLENFRLEKVIFNFYLKMHFIFFLISY